MILKKQSVQEELFGLSKMENIKQQIRDLDRLISKALKQKEYAKARDLTEKQELLLQQMVDKKE